MMELSLKDFSKICRICMGLTNLEPLENLKPKTINLLRTLAGSKHFENDLLPQNICKTCKNCLEDLVRFVNKLKTNNDILESILLHQKDAVPCYLDSNFEESNQSSTANEVDENTKSSSKPARNSSTIDYEKHKLIKCPVCKANVGNTFSKLRIHYKVNSKCRPADYKCKICHKSFYPKYKLAVHLKLHKMETYTCHECSKTFTLAESLRKHVQGHEGAKPLICKLCDKRFLRKRSLDEHTNLHIGKKPYVCVFCGESFSRLSARAAHTYDVHNMTLANIPKLKRKYTEKRVHLSIPCETCGKIFASRSGYDNHQLIHKGFKRFLCNVCGKSFITNATFLIHMRIHSGEKPFECKYCERSFKQKHSLQRHMKHTKHIGLLKCPHCERGYQTESILNNNVLQAGTSKQFVCPHCSKTFNKPNSPTLQISKNNKHRKERNHKCSICSKSFSFASHLDVHLRTHSGEKPYPCPECGKQLAQPQTLKVHMRQHSGETPFICSVCNKGYRDSSNLKRHLKRKHEKVPVKSGEGNEKF